MQGNVCPFSFLFWRLSPVAVRRLSSEFGNAAEFFWLYNRIGHEQEIRAFTVRFPSTHTARERRGKGGPCQSGFWLDVPSAQQISSFPALELHKRVTENSTTLVLISVHIFFASSSTLRGTMQVSLWNSGRKRFVGVVSALGAGLLLL